VGEGVGSWFEDNLRRVVGNGHNTLFWYDCWVGEMPLRLKFPRLFKLAVIKECSMEEMSRLGWTEGGRAWECSILLHNVNGRRIVSGVFYFIT